MNTHAIMLSWRNVFVFCRFFGVFLFFVFSPETPLTYNPQCNYVSWRNKKDSLMHNS